MNIIMFQWPILLILLKLPPDCNLFIMWSHVLHVAYSVSEWTPKKEYSSRKENMNKVLIPEKQVSLCFKQGCTETDYYGKT